MVKALALIALLILSACASPPRDFETGKEVAPLPGCIDYRARGGEC